MAKTDRQTDKTTQWAMTVYEEQFHLLIFMPELVAEWGWQDEICPDTQRPHRQGYFRTKRQVRFSQAKSMLPGVHIEPAKNWAALLKYCKKTDTAVEGSQVHQTNTTKAMTMADALLKLAYYAIPITIGDHEWEKANIEDIIKKRVKDQFWTAVITILWDEPTLVSLYSQPQYLTTWANTKSLWMEIAAVVPPTSWADEKTDRQTDSLPNNAFEN